MEYNSEKVGGNHAVNSKFGVGQITYKSKQQIKNLFTRNPQNPDASSTKLMVSGLLL